VRPSLRKPKLTVYEVQKHQAYTFSSLGSCAKSAAVQDYNHIACSKCGAHSTSQPKETQTDRVRGSRASSLHIRISWKLREGRRGDGACGCQGKERVASDTSHEVNCCPRLPSHIVLDMRCSLYVLPWRSLHRARGCEERDTSLSPPRLRLNTTL